MNYYGIALSTNPLVSIIIDTYYRPDMLKHAVECLLGQTYTNIEIIIVNNGATAETINYLSKLELEEKKIVIIHFKENQFSWEDPQMLVRICFNAGLKISKGELIFYQADDDWVASDFIERMVNLFTNNYRCNTAIGRVVNAYPDGTIINYYPVIKREKYIEGKELALDFITNKNLLNQPNPGHSFVIKRDILMKFGGFQDTFEKQQILGIVPFGETGFDPEALMFWGRHPKQLNVIGTKRLIFWGQYFLTNLENSNDSFVEKWKVNFGEEDANKMQKYCHSVITTSFFQIIFSCLFRLNFYGCIIFVRKFKKRIKIIDFDILSILTGCKEAFWRTKIHYIIKLVYLFVAEFLKSPLNALKKTVRFAYNR